MLFKPKINLFHVVAAVSDMDRTLKFYRDTLDFKVIMDVRNYEAVPGSGNLSNISVVERADDVIAMMEFTQYLNKNVNPQPPYPSLGLWLVTWEVKDLDKIYAKWEKRGVEFTMKPTKITVPDSAIFYSAVFKDVDGNRIELAQLIPWKG